PPLNARLPLKTSLPHPHPPLSRHLLRGGARVPQSPQGRRRQKPLRSVLEPDQPAQPPRGNRAREDHRDRDDRLDHLWHAHLPHMPQATPVPRTATSVISCDAAGRRSSAASCPCRV